MVDVRSMFILNMMSRNDIIRSSVLMRRDMVHETTDPSVVRSVNRTQMPFVSIVELLGRLTRTSALEFAVDTVDGWVDIRGLRSLSPLDNVHSIWDISTVGWKYYRVFHLALVISLRGECATQLCDGLVTVQNGLMCIGKHMSNLTSQRICMNPEVMHLRVKVSKPLGFCA